MPKTVPISEGSIVAVLKGLPENVLIDVFSKVLIKSDSSPLTAEEQASYKKALREYEKGESID